MTIITRDSINPQNCCEVVCQTNDILRTIFSHLNFNDLVIIDLVRKQWNGLASNPAWLKERIYEEMAFGTRQWRLYGGEKFLWGAEEDREALPENIGKIFKSLCPVKPGKRVWETHSLVWVDKAMNLRNYGELAEKHLPESNHGYYKHCNAEFFTAETDESTDESHWILVTNDPLPESLGKNYETHENTVAELAKEAMLDYSMPTRFEAVAYILTGLLISKAKEFPFGCNWTDCQKEVKSSSWINGRRAVVGCLSQDGLYVVSHSDYDNVSVCVVALRKFYWFSAFGNLVLGS